MQLNEKQSYTMKRVLSGKNLFIDGPGGVGKSVLVREIQKHFSDSTVFLAPTGIAALNIGGSTIHRAFKFPLHFLTKKDHGNIRSETQDLFDKNGPVKRIVIDEISMVRADLFEAIDHKLRKIRRLNIPFGGLQVIVVGDFYQLPPVVVNNEKKLIKDYYGHPYAFFTSTWSEAEFEYVHLNQIMRQSDEIFIKNLMNVRTKNDKYKESVDFFNQHMLDIKSDLEEQDPTFLCSINKTSNMINEMNYKEMDGEEHIFKAIKTGDIKTEPAPYELKIKYGTKVMLLANTDTYNNGHVGYVTGFVGDFIEVLIDDEREHTVLVEKFKWEEREYCIKDENLSSYPVGTYTQYPIKYGWASTIHKCQGQTLNTGIIDLGYGAFCHGQTYVALSRMRSLNGLALTKSINYKDVIVDKVVTEFYDNGCRGIGLF